MINKILFATDFSRLSKDAFVYCCQLAKRVDAEVLGVYALKLPQPVYSFPSQAEADLDSLEKQSQARLERFFEHPAVKGVRLRRRLGLGVPQRVINEIASQEKVDLIVVAKNSRAPVERFFVGSVTERVLRRAPCPVLVFPDEGVHTLAWRPVVCGVDFSATSVETFEFAVRFAGRYQTELAAVHVVDVEPDLGDSARAHLEVATRDGEKRLKELAAKSAAPARTRLVVVPGKPGAQLVESALGMHSDLLVIGLRGEFVERGMGAGSTVYAALRASSLPVLVMP